MKQLFLFLLLVVCLPGWSQPMLNSEYPDVLKSLRKNDAYSKIREEVSADGSKTIYATMENGELHKWFFHDNQVIQYTILCDKDSVNLYISLMNKNFVRDEQYQWSDYSSGYRTFWHLYKSGDYFFITATLFDIEI